MRSVGVAALGLLLSPFAFSQTSASSPSEPPAPQQLPPAQTQQPPSYANYSIMLVSPTVGAVVLMHNPTGQLEYVDVNNTKQAFAAGYVPARVSEIAELIGSLKEEIDRLTAENRNLRTEQVKMQPPPQTNAFPAQAQIETQRRAEAEAQKAARRQQLLQTWMMLQGMNRSQAQPYQLPMPMNPNANRLQTNCTTTHVGDTAYTDCH